MTQGKRMMHVGIRAGDVGGYVLLPGSPERAALIASYLDCAQEVAYNREYRTFTGLLSGVRVSVTSTGMGGPSMAIAVEELHECGAHTFLRVGTCEPVSDRLRKGELLLPNGAVRMEGVAQHYLPDEFPAVPDMELLACIKQAADANGTPHHVGVVITKACFSTQYLAATRPVHRLLQDKWEAYVAGGALAAEMSCAPLFVICESLRTRAGAVLTASCDAAKYSDDAASWQQAWERTAAQTAIGALRRLIGRDEERGGV